MLIYSEYLIFNCVNLFILAHYTHADDMLLYWYQTGTEVLEILHGQHGNFFTLFLASKHNVFVQ